LFHGDDDYFDLQFLMPNPGHILSCTPAYLLKLVRSEIAPYNTAFAASMTEASTCRKVSNKAWIG